MTPRAWRALAAGWLAVVALAVAAAPASAHATLVSTDPAEGEVLGETPDVVTFTFDETVSLTDRSIQVFDAAGEPVESDATAEDEVVTADLPDTLADGTYVVAWRVVSADGHPISGSLTFSIGAPSETVVPPPLEGDPVAGTKADLGITHAVGYAALLVAGGLLVFVLWMVGDLRLPAAAADRLRRTQYWAVGVTLAAGLLGLPLTGAYQQGLGMDGLTDPASYDLDLIGDDVLVLGLQALCLVLALLVRSERGLATLVVAVAVASPALVGHTRAFDPVSLLIVTDALHLVAGAVWLGGLVGLALTLPALAARRRDAAALVSRFSTVAAGVLAVLVVSGTLTGWRVVRSWDNLFGTSYGVLLLVKVGIALLAVGVAAWNRWRLLPRAEAVVGMLRRTVLAEACLLLAVVTVTGFLVDQPPREQGATVPPGASAVESTMVGDHRVLATLTPGTRGRNTVTVQVQDRAGEPVDTVAAPVVSVASDDVDLGEVEVAPVGAGTYAARVVLPAPGQWRVQVSLRTSRFDNPVVTLEFDVE